MTLSIDYSVMLNLSSIGRMMPTVYENTDRSEVKNSRVSWLRLALGGEPYLFMASNSVTLSKVNDSIVSYDYHYLAKEALVSG